MRKVPGVVPPRRIGGYRVLLIVRLVQGPLSNVVHISSVIGVS